MEAIPLTDTSEALRLASASYDNACVAYGTLLDDAWSLREQAGITFDKAHEAHRAQIVAATRRFSQA